MKIFYLLMFLILNTLSVFSQVKTEKEYRVKRSEVPKEALKWMNDSFEGLKKVKWYYEESQQKYSFEAKLKFKGKDYSVEFDTLGVIEDIEVLMDWNETEPKAKQAIQAYFDSSYTRYKIIKIQKQYTGKPEDLEDLMDEDEVQGITIKYEIEFQGKTAEENELWEGLFDDQGKLIQRKKIQLLPTNNMEF